MTKEIDVKEAKNWDDDEAEFNDRYLRDRGRDAEADEALKARGGKPTGPTDDDAPPDGNVDEVLDWVGTDTVRAQAALDKENASDKPRVSLTENLEAILAQ